MSADQIEKILEKLEGLKDSLVKEIQSIQLNCQTHRFKTDVLWNEREDKAKKQKEDPSASKRETFYWKVICGLIAIAGTLINLVK